MPCLAASLPRWYHSLILVTRPLKQQVWTVHDTIKLKFFAKYDHTKSAVTDVSYIFHKPWIHRIASLGLTLRYIPIWNYLQKQRNDHRPRPPWWCNRPLWSSPGTYSSLSRVLDFYPSSSGNHCSSALSLSDALNFNIKYRTDNSNNNYSISLDISWS